MPKCSCSNRRESKTRSETLSRTCGITKFIKLIKTLTSVRVFYFCPMTDYILVGGGLAGMAFAQTAWQNGKSVAIYDGLTAGASRIASGLYNPVVLKRLNAVADASEYLQSMEAFYPKVDDRL